MVYNGNENTRVRTFGKWEELGMFENIGGKLKALSKAICWLGIIASVIVSFVLLGVNSYYNRTAVTGIIVLFVGCLGSYLGSMFTYAFGELVEDIHVMKNANDLATMRPRYRQAVNYMKQKKYDKAADIFADISSFEDSETLEKECIFCKAIEQKANSKYDEAAATFESIAPYKDAEEQVKECRYQLGCAKLASKDFDAAYDAFEMAANYKDASDMLCEVRYIQAKHLVEVSREEEAFDFFICILEYKDVRKIVESNPIMKQMLNAFENDEEECVEE